MKLDRFSRRSIVTLLGASWLTERASPESASVIRPTAASEIWNRAELYFGAGKPDGSMVSDLDFSLFLNNEVTPRFPDGLTLLKGYGQFRNSRGIIQSEDSRVLILFYPPQMQDANIKIQQIRESYKSAFQQESVLRADSYNLISF